MVSNVTLTLTRQRVLTAPYFDTCRTKSDASLNSGSGTILVWQFVVTRSFWFDVEPRRAQGRCRCWSALKGSVVILCACWEGVEVLGITESPSWQRVRRQMPSVPKSSAMFLTVTMVEPDRGRRRRRELVWGVRYNTLVPCGVAVAVARCNGPPKSTQTKRD